MAENTPKLNDQQVKLVQYFEALSQKHSAVLTERLDSVEEMLVAMLVDSSGASEADCIDVVRSLRDQFVDWNEMRVARIGELARVFDVLGAGDDLARRVRELLGLIFERVGRVSFYHLEEMKSSDARRALMDIEPINRDAASRIIMLEVPESTIPFSDEAIEVVRKAKLIDKNKTKQQFQKTVEETFSREQGIDFFYLLEAEAHGGSATKTTKTSTTSKKKTKPATGKAAKA